MNTLIYTMGDAADNIFQAFMLQDENRKKYEVTKEKFEKHFMKKRNIIIYERAKLNSRRQEDGETADLFITALYNLAERCEYGALHDDMIRDRIIVGIKDSSLSERMQLHNALTLEKATRMVRQSEAVKLQQSEMRRLPNERSLEAIKMGRKVYRTMIINLM